jgi:hypothetical protein
MLEEKLLGDAGDGAGEARVAEEGVVTLGDGTGGVEGEG